MKTITHSLLGILLLTINFAIAQPPPGFFLINTDTGAELGPLDDGDTINWAEYGSVNLGILLYPDQAPGGVYFTLRGPLDHTQAEGASPPYSLFGDIGVIPNGRLFPIGDYYLRAKPINAPAYEINFSVIEEDPVCATGMDTEPPVARCKDTTITLDVNGFAFLTVSDVDNGSTDNCGILSRSIENEFIEVGVFPVILTVRDFEGNTDTCASMVTVEPYDPNESDAELILVNADTDETIIKLNPNVKINKNLIGDGPIGIIFNPAEAPGGVNFRLRGPVNETRSEGANPPYSVFGDIGVDIQGVPFPIGNYTIEANPNVGETLFIGFEIVDSYIPGTFVTTWKTDNPGPSPANQITIPTYPGETYNYTVNWGDGHTTPGYSGDATHTYGSPGTYTVSITGQFPGINFGRDFPSIPPDTDSEKILTVNQWGNIQWQRMDNAFYSCTNFDVVATDIPDLSDVSNLDRMFGNADQFIGNSSFALWNTSTITSMIFMFAYTQFNEPIGNWDVSNVTNMGGMFENAEAFNQPIGNWNVTNVTNMHVMFQSALSFNQPIGGWDVSNVTNMIAMFEQALNFNQDIGNWDVSNVTTMEAMFALQTSFNQDISSWDTSNVENMVAMFYAASGFNQSLSQWDISSVTTMEHMFGQSGLSTANYDATLIGWNSLDPGETLIPTNIIFDGGFSQYCDGATARQNLIDTNGWMITDGGENCYPDAFITTWKTDNPGASAPNQITIPTYPGETYDYVVVWGDGTSDIGVTGDITHTYANPGTYMVSIAGQFPGINFGMGGTFPFETDFEKILFVNQWGNNQWERMDFAFSNCIRMDVVAIDAPDLSSVTSLDYLFTWSRELKGNAAFNTWNTSNVTSMESALAYTQYNDPLDNWDVSNVTNMVGMFENAEEFNQPIGGWDVSNVTDMSFMFNDAIGFNQDISSWNVSSVTNMRGLFSFASDFNQDIENWDVSKVTDMAFMFSDAYSFNQNLSNWDIGSVTTMNGMFTYAQSFDQDLGGWDISSVTQMLGMFLESGLSTANYDDTLMGWSGLPSLQPGVIFDAGYSQYCDAATERAQIISDYNWEINDNGKNCAGIGLYGFRLIDADTDMTITDNLVTDTSFVLDWLPESLTFDVYKVFGPVESVRMEITGPINFSRIENVAPYALFGDIAGDYGGRTFVEGDYTLSATPYSGNNGTGIAGPTITLNFSMVYESTNLKSPSGPSLRLSPNPATTSVEAVLTESEPIQKMMLFDMQGRLVREISGQQARTGRMNVSEFPTGLYILKAIGTKGTISQEQMVIER